MIRLLKSKDLLNFLDFCSKRDQYSDFYIENHNNRFFLNESKIAKQVFFKCLKHSYICLVYEEKDNIEGILFIDRIKEIKSKYFIRILSKNNAIIRHFFKALVWYIDRELYINVKKYNPISYISKKFGFRFQSSNGKEIILLRDPKDRKRIKNEFNK